MSENIGAYQCPFCGSHYADAVDMANCVLRCNKTMEDNQIKAIEEKIQKLYKELLAEIDKYVEAGGKDLYKASLTCTTEEKNSDFNTVKIPNLEDGMTVFDFTDNDPKKTCRFYSSDKLVDNSNIIFDDAFSAFDKFFDNPYDFTKKSKKDSFDSIVDLIGYVNKNKNRLVF